MSEGYKTEEVYFKRDNLKLYGKLYLPENFDMEAFERKLPVFIYTHGYGATGVTGTFYARELAKWGCACLCLDFAGGGQYSKSEGSSQNMSLFSEVSDIETAFEFVKGLKFADTEKIIPLGESLGGMAAAVFADQHPDYFPSMILLYPGFCFREIVKEKFGSLEEIPDEFAYLPNLSVGKKFAEDLWNFDVYEHIGNFKNHVLLIHGSGDTLVDVEYSKKAEKVYQNAQLHVIDRAEHGFRGRDFREAICCIKDFLKKNSTI